LAGDLKETDHNTNINIDIDINIDGKAQKMDEYGLPVQFGKIQAKPDISNKISETKRNDPVVGPSGQPAVSRRFLLSKMICCELIRPEILME
jgi:hypothetical protein